MYVAVHTCIYSLLFGTVAATSAPPPPPPQIGAVWVFYNPSCGTQEILHEHISTVYLGSIQVALVRSAARTLDPPPLLPCIERILLVASTLWFNFFHFYIITLNFESNLRTCAAHIG